MMGRSTIHPLETLITALLLLMPIRSTARVTTEQIRVLLLIKLVYRLRVIMLLEAILLAMILRRAKMCLPHLIAMGGPLLPRIFGCYRMLIHRWIYGWMY